jgi:hypothetical protein
MEFLALALPPLFAFAAAYAIRRVRSGDAAERALWAGIVVVALAVTAWAIATDGGPHPAWWGVGVFCELTMAVIVLRAHRGRARTE